MSKYYIQSRIFHGSHEVIRRGTIDCMAAGATDGQLKALIGLI